MPELYIGLMSGTSVDGVDAALVDFADDQIKLVGFHYQEFPDLLKQTIHRLSDADALVSLREYGSLDAELGKFFAQTVVELLSKTQLPASLIRAVGSHGQTVYHAPGLRNPFSLQIGDPNVIAELTGIATVADFRRRDIAVGGQGAPLVPAFHQAIFTQANQHRCIVNIGGIANITVLPADISQVTGFDTGPGNTLLDQWIKKHKNQHYDGNGAWAKSGKANRQVVDLLMQDDYFQAPPPKSTGKEYFSLAWLAQKVTLNDYKPEDIQASLCHLTATSICTAIKEHAPLTQQVILCGGGVHNQYLLELLQGDLPCPVSTTEPHGVHPDHVEAMAFAWLARQTVKHLPGNLKEVTGAERAVVLGGVYPGLNCLAPYP